MNCEHVRPHRFWMHSRLRPTFHFARDGNAPAFGGPTRRGLPSRAWMSFFSQGSKLDGLKALNSGVAAGKSFKTPWAGRDEHNGVPPPLAKARARGALQPSSEWQPTLDQFFRSEALRKENTGPSNRPFDDDDFQKKNVVVSSVGGMFGRIAPPPPPRLASAIGKLYPGLSLNAMQEQVAPALLGGCGNVVVGAPTGSGKTLLLEIAVCKFFLGDERTERKKALYVAPMKVRFVGVSVVPH